MSDGLNRVELLGRLGRDGELRFSATGTAILNFSLATDDSYVDKDKVKHPRTEWHRCTVFGPFGQTLAPMLVKGAQCFVEGSLRTSSYEKDGQKVFRTDIVCTKVILCGGRGEGGDSQSHAPTDNGQGQGGSAAPQQAGYQRGASTAAPSSGVKSAGDFNVPFGRDKGKKISEVPDLSWLREAISKTLNDPSKDRFHEKARGEVAAIDEEITRRGGGAQQSQAPQRPADEYEVEGGGGNPDDDIPF